MAHPSFIYGIYRAVENAATGPCACGGWASRNGAIMLVPLTPFVTWPPGWFADTMTCAMLQSRAHSLTTSRRAQSVPLDSAPLLCPAQNFLRREFLPCRPSQQLTSDLVTGISAPIYFFGR